MSRRASTAWRLLFRAVTFSPLFEIARVLVRLNHVARINGCLQLRFALEKQPIEQQQDHSADDRHNPARWLSGLVPAEGFAEVSANERASDAEQNRDD
jgi:hypothetical protein